MPHNKGYSSGRTRRDLLKVIGINVLLVIFICACNFTAGFSKPTTEPDMTVWEKTESPLFPTSWPPTSDTTWVRYTFAYGNNPSKLMDGAYVTDPLSKTEWKGGISTTTTELSNQKTQAAVQGVIPLDDQTRKILDNEKQVSANCLKITKLPDPNSPETREMLTYYHAWFKYNNAFLDLIRKNHPDFIAWVSQN